jgi:MT0933-like antitoxin protein
MPKLTSKALIAMAGTAAMKARTYAQENPHKVEQALGKVEGTLSRRTGGKYDTHVGKGTSAVRKGLGLPDAAGPGNQADPYGGVTTASSSTASSSPASSSTPPPPPSWAAGTDGPAPTDADRGQPGHSPRDGS